MASTCDLYATPSSQWPVSAYPATEFPRNSAFRDAYSQRAWNFFELVENQDAQTRVRLSQTGAYCENPWYIFKSQTEYSMYRRGKLLHQQLCPDRSWVSQRDLGIPAVPLTDVTPGVCSITPAIRDTISEFMAITSVPRQGPLNRLAQSTPSTMSPLQRSLYGSPGIKTVNVPPPTPNSNGGAKSPALSVRTDIESNSISTLQLGSNTSSTAVSSRRDSVASEPPALVVTDINKEPSSQ